MKVLPHSLEAERGLLGSILISPIILKELASLIDVDYFYDSDNKKIAEKILSLFSSNKTIDILTVSNALEGMTGILVDITDSIYTTSNARSYIDILRKKSVQRSLIYAGDHIARLAYEDRDVNDLVIDAQKSIRALDNNNGKTHKIANLVMKLQDEIEDVLLNGDTTIYFDTGIDDIKLARGRTTRLSAYNNTGKSSLSYFVCNNALRQGAKVLYISLEVTPEEVMNNLLCNWYKLPMWQFEKKSTLKDVDFSEYGSKNIHIAHGINDIEEIERNVRMIEPDVVFIDYVQLVKAPGINEQERMMEYARRIQKVALDHNIAIFDLSQIPNDAKVYKKGDVTPTRGSSELGNSANYIYVMQDSPDIDGMLEVHLAKNRHGIKGIAFGLKPDFQIKTFTHTGKINLKSNKF